MVIVELWFLRLETLTTFIIFNNLFWFLVWIQCRQHLELLLESIPTMFQNSRIAESSFSAAIKVCSCLLVETVYV